MSRSPRCSIPLRWLPVHGGRLALSGRPRLRAFPRLAADGCTHVLTLQSEREDAPALGRAAAEAGLGWLWLPFAHGQPPMPERSPEIAAMLARVAGHLAEGAGVLIHCAAGIHRTGMIAYALLRSVGHEPPVARALLTELRPITGDGVGDARLAWADALFP